MRGYKGGGGWRHGCRLSCKNHKNIGSLSKTGPNPLISQKLPNQRSVLSRHWPTNETPFDEVSLACRRWPEFNGIWICSSKTKTSPSKLDPPETAQETPRYTLLNLKLLTLLHVLGPINFSIKLHTIQSEWSILYIEGSQVIISENKYCISFF